MRERSTCIAVLPSGETCPRREDGKGRGYCPTHYLRFRLYGDPRTDKPIRAYGRKGCSISGCKERHYSYGWCESHVRLWKRNGDPNVRKLAPARQADYYSNGYHFIYANGRIIQEHRHVMEQHLGRPLLPGEEVHHKNGQRRQNDIGNLELWTKSQPKGQRAVDLLAWAEEIVARYGPERDLL